jgi:anti-sigma regulatory factor (Ser/Thr protein kinase)
LPAIAIDMDGRTVDRVCPTVDAVPPSARAARQFVAELLRAHGATTEVIGDYTLVVSELVTNVIEHSAGSQVEIIVNSAEPQWWEVEVVGGAPAAPKQMLAPEMWTVAGAHEVSGRGLGIVRQLMDDVVTEVADDRISVRCRRRR